MLRVRRDAGISMVLVVILFLLTLILAVTAVVLWADYKDKQRMAEALREVENEVNDEEARIKALMAEAVLPTGFTTSEDGRLNPSKSAEVMRTVRDRYWSEAELNSYPRSTGEAKPMTPEFANLFREGQKGSEYNTTLQDLAPLAAARVLYYKNMMERYTLELRSAEVRTENQKTLAPQVPEKKNEYLQTLEQDIQKISADIAQEQERFNARRTLLAEARAKAEEEIAAEAAKFAEDQIRIENENRELRRQLEELKVKEVIKHQINFAHGKILEPDIPNKTAFINLGAPQRIVPGLKFLVGKRGVGGRFEYKGKVEVKKVWPQLSEVAIIELEDPEEKPIIDGDLLVNPLFSKDRPVVVAFVGEENARRLRYSVDEATRRIMEIGSVVRPEVALDVDYVIFTEPQSGRSEANYEGYVKAVDLEIPVAQASEVYRFLGD